MSRDASRLLFIVEPKNDPLSKAPPKTGQILIEVDRFIDARSFGTLHFGVAEVAISVYHPGMKAYPRWQLRWEGRAASNPSSLRLQARRVKGPRSRVEWADVRHL